MTSKINIMRNCSWQCHGFLITLKTDKGRSPINQNWIPSKSKPWKWCWISVWSWWRYYSRVNHVSYCFKYYLPNTLLLLKNEAYGNMTSVYLSYWENVINFYEYETFSDPVLKRRFDRQATPGTTALNETSQDEVTNLLVKEVLGKYKFCHVQLNKTLIVFLYSFVWVLFENRPALHFCNYIYKKKTILVYWIPYLLMIL